MLERASREDEVVRVKSRRASEAVVPNEGGRRAVAGAFCAHCAAREIGGWIGASAVRPYEHDALTPARKAIDRLTKGRPGGDDLRPGRVVIAGSEQDGGKHSAGENHASRCASHPRSLPRESGRPKAATPIRRSAIGERRSECSSDMIFIWTTPKQ
jgi:hypothetical protein